MKIISESFIFIVLILILASCKEKQANTGAIRVERWNGGIPQDPAPNKWYFEMNQKQIDTLFSRLNEINLKDTITNVTNILGMPDYDDVVETKVGSKFLDRLLRYYVRKKDKISGNNYDQLIRFYFDSNNKLTEIESNVPGHQFTKGSVTFK